MTIHLSLQTHALITAILINFYIVFFIARIIGVYLSLYANETFLSNGSTIAYTDISIGRIEDSGSLVCNTDKTECCESNSEGNWYSVNGSVITEDNQEFSVIRNTDLGKITLLRNNWMISSFNSLCCRAPDASNIYHTVCVHSG